VALLSIHVGIQNIVFVPVADKFSAPREPAVICLPPGWISCILLSLSHLSVSRLATRHSNSRFVAHCVTQAKAFRPTQPTPAAIRLMFQQLARYQKILPSHTNTTSHRTRRVIDTFSEELEGGRETITSRVLTHRPSSETCRASYSKGVTWSSRRASSGTTIERRHWTASRTMARPLARP